LIRRSATPRFYFSFRSPYSWLGYRDLLGRHPDVAAALEWRPFWEPDDLSMRMLTEAGGEFPYTAMSRAKHLYILMDVRRQVAERGLTMAWPVDRDPCWEVPHLAYLLAADRGRARDYVDLVYRARWEHGANICDRRVVGDIAVELGLDREELVTASDREDVRRRGVEALLAIDRDGVFGVPFFVSGFDRYWGTDRLEAFVGALRARGAPPAPPPELAAVPPTTALPLEGGGGLVSPLASTAVRRITDGGHAGGCG
jgi:2-hydroxychromene-2-carboxylate isomerase